ncbi:MAG: twin-arginine translocase subunit TatB [Alcaligenaceae bacterium]|jgi:sec-independent protein translocase protein TatB|nr:twin-arginine translocase subunit TatB [Alcaligenaceae bacterium]
MFDISFTELMVIGMIALVVIGPERLPKVARTLGHLLGRAQRYVNDVKTDIKREMDAGDLNNLKNQFDEARSSVQASLDDASRTIANPMLEAQKAVENAGKSLQASMVDFEGQEAAVQPELSGETSAPSASTTAVQASANTNGAPQASGNNTASPENASPPKPAAASSTSNTGTSP